MIKVSIKSAIELFKGLIDGISDSGSDPQIEEWEALYEFWTAFPKAVRDDIIKFYTKSYKRPIAYPGAPEEDWIEDIILVLIKRSASSESFNWDKEYKRTLCGVGD